MLMERHLKKIEIPIDALLPFMTGELDRKLELPDGTNIYDVYIDRERRLLVVVTENNDFKVISKFGEVPPLDNGNFFWTLG